MRRLADRSFDLAIADPPYGAATPARWQLPADHGLAGFGGAWRLADHDWDALGGVAGFRFTLAWLGEVARLVRPEGSIWIHATYHNSGVVNVACQILGLEIINEVVWFKRNAFPNLAGKRLTASHETILWVHTGGPRNRQYRFNYAAVKAAAFPGDAFKVPGRQLRTVWDIPNNKAPEELRYGKHPTQKPLRLLDRIFLIAGAPGGNFLSPFAGSGSDLAAAVRHGMHATGFEVDPDFVAMARKRLALP
ncbi:MAG: site-specific DNA-methyltransferase [Candidatus Sericytochromatia bacterium]|nr:site-specific DNA-methyltransferase [Candidatus Tanganyikabacteria bacterium]